MKLRRLVLVPVLGMLVLGLGSNVSADATQPDPQQQQAVIDQIRAQLGSNLADAMAAQQQLKQSLVDNANQQRDVQAKIVDAEA
jgi:hypothetical protein